MRVVRVPYGTSFRSRLARLGACYHSRDWVGRKSLRCAWRTCQRAEWMLWFAGRVGVPREALMAAACDCVATAIDDDRELLAHLQVAREWALGRANRPDLAAAARAVANWPHHRYLARAVHLVLVTQWSVIPYTTTADAVLTAACGGADDYYVALRRYADIVRASIPLAEVEEALVVGE